MVVVFVSTIFEKKNLIMRVSFQNIINTQGRYVKEAINRR